MKIEPIQITVRELVDGYQNSDELGVYGYRGKLNIRPPFQREFVYKFEQKVKVIDSILKGYPLNVMYWVKNPNVEHPEDESLATFEVLDGQQRTLSICGFVVEHDPYIIIDGHKFFFANLPSDVQEKILNYKLTIYVCEGSDSEKIDWFQTINIAGAELTKQELLNATYTGPWLTKAKEIFSKTNCSAYELASDYVKGSPIRQEILELALKWASPDRKPSTYMSKHQNDKTATHLWNHFSSIINWVKANFTVVRKEMKGVDWAILYERFKDVNLDPDALESRIEQCMLDEEVGNKSGIYSYVLTGDKHHLNLRPFSDKIKREIYTKQKGLCASSSCPDAGKVFKIDEMEGDHIDPWHSGGKTTAENCQMLCKPCNRRKGGK